MTTATATRARVDRDALWQALDRAREARRLTWSQVASEVGTSASTFSRLKRGFGTDADTFAGILDWLGAGHEHFLASSAGRAQVRPTLPAVTAVLRAAPGMTEDQREEFDAFVAAWLRTLQRRKSVGARRQRKPR